jgi:LysR family nitrogen assimilation transcriptional regulator
VDGVGAILDLVGEGFGHAILSRNAVSNLGSGQPLQIRPIAGPGLNAKLALAVNSHRQITATQQALIELVRHIVGEQLQTVERPGTGEH